MRQFQSGPNCFKAPLNRIDIIQTCKAFCFSFIDNTLMNEKILLDSKPV